MGEERREGAGLLLGQMSSSLGQRRMERERSRKKLDETLEPFKFYVNLKMAYIL